MEADMENLFSTDSFDESIIQLKEELKIDSQINYYDFIYNRHIDNTPNDRLEEVIKGSNRVIKILLFASYYRNLIYSKAEPNNEECQLKLLQILHDDIVINDEFNMKSFSDMIIRILNVLTGKNYNNFPRGIKYTYIAEIDRYIIPYFLIGNKATILSINDICDLYFINSRIIKHPSACPLINIKVGSHNDIYNNVLEFFFHDAGHMFLLEENVKSKIMFFNDYRNFYLLCRSKGILSFIHRYCSFMLFSTYHEFWISNRLNLDLKTFISNFEENFILSDIKDSVYCLTYVTKAYDFDFESKENIDLIKSRVKVGRTGNLSNDFSSYYEEIKLMMSILNIMFLEQNKLF